MRLRSSLSVLIVLLFTARSFAAEVPKERIIWSRALLGTLGLYLSDRDGINERPLLAGPESNYNPSFSSDGHWIVFTSERSGSAHVFRVHPDGSGLDQLTDGPAFDDQGALSPDGRTLAFVSTREGGTANIWLKDIGKEAQAFNLTRNRAGNFRPSWSPDGKWIAFSSDRDTHRVRFVRDTGLAWELMQTTAVYIVHPDGSGLRRLTPLAGSAGSPKWSRDGRRVILTQVADVENMRHFRPRLQIVSIDIASGAREMHSEGSVPSYVSSTEIGYLGEAGILYNSGRKGPAAAKNPSYSPENPSWSPDGSLLVYDKRIPLAQPRWMEVSASRDPRYELIGGDTVLERFPPPVVVTPRAEGFIYRSDSSQQLIHIDWNGTVSRVIFDGSPQKRAFHDDQALSADGRTLAVAIWTSARPEEVDQIAVMNSDGSSFRVLPHDPLREGCRFLSLSPEGQRLVCAVGGMNHGFRTKGGLRIVSLSDGKTVKLTGGWDNTPAWSPRGDWIAFTGFESGDFEIYKIRPDGTGLRQLTHTHGNDSHPVWSPDGQWIAFTSSRMGWKDEALLPWHGPQTYGEIFVMGADGNDIRQLTDNQWEEAPSAWIPPVSKVVKLTDPTHHDR
jgi:TolB protein